MEESKQGKTCVLCFDQIKYIGIGQCNHKEMCYTCHFKMRSFNQNKQCPLCNSFNMELIVTDDFELDFENYNLDNLEEFEKKAGIYALNSKIMEDLEKLVQIKCFAYNCNDQTIFQNISNLKKHLKEKHMRHLCDICVEYKTCILSEQKLYTQQGLDKHTKKGDFDEDGNVYFFHPYCNFCLKYFYDEEAIVKHMPDHYPCFVCGPEHKYIYYKNYKQLEKHFRISHYFCEDPSCIEKCFIAFKTAPELEIHNAKYHNSQFSKKHTFNNVNLQTMTGFNFGKINDGQVITRDDFIKDKEGVDFENQFLSHRKMKMKNTHIDSHSDEPIDYRDFYCQKYDEKYVKEEEDILKQYYVENYGGREKNLPKNKRAASQKGEQLFKEDIPLLRYHQIHGMNGETLLNKLGLVLDQEKYEKLEDSQRKMTKKHLSPHDFFEELVHLSNKHIALRLFPVIAASLNVKYELIQKEMDEEYITQIKALPSKHLNMINSSQTYMEFFKLFRKLIEEQLSLRIRSGKLKLNLKELKMDRSRRFQLIEILRRVKTKEMAKLKFISNFGVSVDVNSMILRKVFFSDLTRVNDLLDTIPNHEFLHLYVYTSYCDDLIQGKDIKKEKQQISANMLRDYFDTHPDIYKEFYPKNEDVDEEYAEEEQKQVGIIEKSSLINKGKSGKSQQIDTQDIYEFPSMNNKSKKPQVQPKAQPEPTLPIEKVANPKEQVKQQNIMSNWEKSKENPFLYESQDSKIRVNQILKEEFPVLGGGKLKPYTVPKKKQQQIFPEEQKQTSQKGQNIPSGSEPGLATQWGGPGSEQIDKHDIKNLKVVGTKKKTKDGQVQVSLAGYFK